MILLSNGKYHKIGGKFTPDIGVIAHSLAHINRFTGHFGTYSVAQHCCHVADRLPAKLQLAGLLHDACEVYLGDVSSPLKKHLTGYAALETMYLARIDQHFKVQTRHPLVVEADLRMLVTEAQAFGADVKNGYWPNAEPYAKRGRKIWSPAEAEQKFLRMFKELTE